MDLKKKNPLAAIVAASIKLFCEINDRDETANATAI